MHRHEELNLAAVLIHDASDLILHSHGLVDMMESLFCDIMIF